jgi:LuxR family transcriptional regulator, maltose regulon positive regulatory protein
LKDIASGLLIKPPSFSINHFSRGRLVELLENPRQGLTFLHAGPGYGKTMLMVEWRDRLVSSGVCCPWVTIQDSSVGAGELLCATALALEQTGMVSDGTPIVAQSAANGGIEQGLSVFFETLDRSGCEFTLFLDGLDRLRSPASWKLLENMIAFRPDKLRFVMASRNRPKFPLQKLRTQGQALELTSDDLAFSDSEVCALLRDMMSPEDAMIASRDIGGWPVAIQLFSIWHRRHGSRLPNLSQFSASREVREYLGEQVMDGLPPALTDLLTDISVFAGDVTPELADATGKRNSSSSLLAEAEFLQPLIRITEGEEPRWRMHSLLVKYLRDTLRAADRTRYLELNRRAAKALAEKGELEEAVRTAMRCQDWKFAVDVVEHQDPLQFCLLYGVRRFRACAELLDEYELRGYPRISLAQIFAKMREGRANEAMDDLCQFDRVHVVQTPEVRLDRLMISIAFAMLLENDSLADVEEFENQYKEIGQDNPLFKAMLSTLYATILLRQSAFEAAEDRFIDAAGLFGASQAPIANAHIQLHLAHIAVARGDLARGAAILQRVSPVIRSLSGPERSLRAMAKASQLWIDYELGQIDFGSRQISGLLDELEHGDAWLDYFSITYSAAVRILFALESHVEALELIDRGRDLLSKRPLPSSFENVLNAHEVAILARAGYVDAALASSTRLDFENRSGTPTLQERDTLLYALGQLAVARNAYQQALDIGQAWLAEAQARKRPLSACRALNLCAVAHSMAGNSIVAKTVLSDAIAIAARQRAMAPFLEMGQHILIVLSDVLPSLSGEQFRFAAKIAADIEVSPLRRSEISCLSLREREVLHMLTTYHGTNKELARRLEISHHAVKYHLKNIFRKLHIESRDEAKLLMLKAEGRA